MSHAKRSTIKVVVNGVEGEVERGDLYLYKGFLSPTKPSKLNFNLLPLEAVAFQDLYILKGYKVVSITKQRVSKDFGALTKVSITLSVEQNTGFINEQVIELIVDDEIEEVHIQWKEWM